MDGARRGGRRARERARARRAAARDGRGGDDGEARDARRSIARCRGRDGWGARAVDYGEKTWRSMAASAPGSARKRLHELGMYAMDRIDPRERALKALPKILSSAEIVYPSGADVGAVRRLVERTAAEGTRNARNGDDDVRARRAAEHAHVPDAGQ